VEGYVSLVGSLLRKRSNVQDGPQWLVEFLGGRGSTSYTGKSITPVAALNYSAVYACVRVIAETIATLPLFLYARQPDGGRDRAQGHALYRLLHDKPNPEMTRVEYWETVAGHLCTWGNSYGEIDRNGGAMPIALWPLRPDKTKPIRLNGRMVYETHVDGGVKLLEGRNVLHIRGLSNDGINGYSPITLAREAIGLGLATEEYGARFFGNDSRPGGVLMHDKKLSEPSSRNLKESWEAAFGGLSNRHRVAILEEGVKWQQIGLPNEDSQFLETRKFQVTEIARIFRVPPHMIGDLERATFSNIEHQAIDFVVHTLRPWLVRIEQRINTDLIPVADQDAFFAEHLVDGLLRGDAMARAQALAIQRQNGVINADEWREIENRNPLPDGQGRMYLVLSNMMDPSQTQQEAEPAPVVVPAQESTQEPAADGAPAARSVGAPVLLRASARVGVASRRRIARSYRRLISEASQRVLSRERSDIMRQAEKMLPSGNAETFLRYLDGYYGEEQQPAFMRRVYEPVLLSLADLIQANAAQQIGSTVGLTDDLEQFVRTYTKSAAYRYGRSSLGQLGQVVRKAQQESADYLDAIGERFDEWDDTRPDKLAGVHSVRCGCAIAKETWRIGGVTAVEWVAVGNNCPWCDSLDGKKEFMNDSFVREGQDYQPEGAPSAIAPHQDIGHPPLHLGCDCSVEPA